MPEDKKVSTDQEETITKDDDQYLKAEKEEVARYVQDLLAKKLRKHEITVERAKDIARKVVEELKGVRTHEEVQAVIPKLAKEFDELKEILEAKVKHKKEDVDQKVANFVEKLIKVGRIKEALALAEHRKEAIEAGEDLDQLEHEMETEYEQYQNEPETQTTEPETQTAEPETQTAEPPSKVPSPPVEGSTAPQIAPETEKAWNTKVEEYRKEAESQVEETTPTPAKQETKTEVLPNRSEATGSGPTDTLGKIKESASGLVEKAKEAGTPLIDKTKDATKKAYEKSKDMAGDALEKGKDELDKFKGAKKDDDF